MQNSLFTISRFGRIALGAAGALAAATVGIAAYMTARISRPRRSHRPPHHIFTPWEFGIAYRDLRIPLGDSHIAGWFLPQEEKQAPCILALSGFASHKAELLGIASNLHRAGFQMLLIDFRGTGESPGDVVTMGHFETEDARAAVDWITREVPNAPIGVIGFSMGGSVALALAATDSRIGAAVSDSAFSEQRSIFAHHVRRKLRIWPEPILTVAGPLLRRRHGRSYADFAPANLVHRISPRPLLLIHPVDDQIVPFEHAERIWRNAREPKESWFPSGVNHCGAYFEDRQAYCSRVAAFFESSLAGQTELAESNSPPAR